MADPECGWRGCTLIRDHPVHTAWGVWTSDPCDVGVLCRVQFTHTHHDFGKGVTTVGDIRTGTNGGSLHDRIPQPDNEVVNPSHYGNGSPPPLQREPPVQVIELLEQVPDWNVAQIIKYVVRYKRKGGLADLQKAQWHLTRITERQAQLESE